MIRSALRNPYLTLVVCLALVVLGVTSYRQLPADLLPIFRTPAVQVVTFYPGMPPEVMERDIMSRLERWTGQSVGIEHQEGKAMLGVCIVKDFFREGISLDTAMSQVTSYAVSDMFYLPPGTIPPMVMPFDPTASVPLCLIAISSTRPANTDAEIKRLEKELYDVAYFELRNRLQSIQGVIAPAVYGGTLRRILAYVDRQRLDAHGLSLMDVQRALRQQNVLIPAGNAKVGDYDYQIFTNAIPETVELLNAAPIKVVDGAVVRISDVGEVRDAAQIQTNVVRINGRRPAMYIPIYRQPGANTIAIVEALKDRLEQILQRLRAMDPQRAEGLTLTLVMDQSEQVKESIQGLQVAGGLGALLAATIVWLFLKSWRLTVLIVLSIPLSILAALIGLYYTGDTINAMTLGGLALSIGILIDQAIVVLDNLERRRAGSTEPLLETAASAASEVALPLFASILSFIVVFYPVVYLSGLAQYLFTPLATAVTIAVIASYVIGLFLVPAGAVVLLRNTPATAPKEGIVLGPLARGYAWLLRRAMRHKLAVTGVAFALLIAALALLGQRGSELFPQVDSGQFTIYARLPAGIRIEKTEETIAAIERIVEDVIGPPDPTYPVGKEVYADSNLVLHISNIGVLMDWPAAYTPNSGPMDAFVLAQLKRKPGMPGTHAVVSELRQRLSAQFPEVEFAFDTGGMLTAALNMGESAPIRVQVSGSQFNELRQIGDLIKSAMKSVPGTTDARIVQRMDYPGLHVEVDRALASYQGVTVDDVMKNLVSATNSSVNFDPAFWIDEKNGNHYFLGVQYYEKDINSLDTLRDVPIRGSRSIRPVPLRNVATIHEAVGPAVITHHNITRTIDVYASVLPGYAVGTVAAELEKRLQANPQLGLERRQGERGEYYQVNGAFQDRGYLLEFQGEVRTLRESFRQFTQGLAIAAILVFLVMVALFRSFATPLLVMVTVPLGLIGVAVILWATDTHLNIQSFMGIIMMMGIVVEYSIVLLDFADGRVRSGIAPAEAVYEAARVRFRPILMTSLTTILALLPMATGFAGSHADQPLAIAIVGGVLAATVLPMLVVPCLYAMCKRGASDPFAKPPRSLEDARHTQGAVGEKEWSE